MITSTAAVRSVFFLLIACYSALKRYLILIVENPVIYVRLRSVIETVPAELIYRVQLPRIVIS